MLSIPMSEAAQAKAGLTAGRADNGWTSVRMRDALTRVRRNCPRWRSGKRWGARGCGGGGTCPHNAPTVITTRYAGISQTRHDHLPRSLPRQMFDGVGGVIPTWVMGGYRGVVKDQTLLLGRGEFTVGEGGLQEFRSFHDGFCAVKLITNRQCKRCEK